MQELVTLRRGERYLIRAASGTGKSSLCSFLYGYRHDYQGTICLDERDLRSFTGQEWQTLRRAHLSMLFQELRLFPELTALENITLKNRLTGFKQPQEIEALLEALGMADKQHRRVGQLSFGQQQRVAFVRALCQPFDFMLLDEPVSHLDDENAAVMATLLTAEADRQGAGLLVTSIGKHLGLPYDAVFHL